MEINKMSMGSGGTQSYPDCGNPRCGFARIRCPECDEETML
jgi:ribosomal protein S27E